MKRKKRPQNVGRQQIPADIMKLLEAMGKGRSVNPKRKGYSPRQGPRECARRVRQMARTKQPTTSTS